MASRNRNATGQRAVANRTTALRPQAFNASNSRIIARHTAGAHPNWDRRRDHNWHGHRCHWYNNAWVIYDLGFYPWAYYGYGYGYPYGPYSYYDNGYYDDQYAANDQQYENGNGDSTVSQVQSALARQGYYHGAIDGSVGPATRNAVRRFQRNHGLDATGEINRSVLDALRLG